MVLLEQLTQYLDQQLKPWLFNDYCPNGLQVEGKPEVRRIITGVTASQWLLEEAVKREADAVLVHHGYFWKGEPQPVVGMKQRRLMTLLQHGISLIAYHLPLDVHPEWGNNAQLAQLLDFDISGGLEPNNPNSVGLVGRLREPMSGSELKQWLSFKLDREPLYVPGSRDKIETIGWCTGAAQGMIDNALALNLDAYLTGEVSEPTVHTARECGIHFFAAGHHATERYGAKALGQHLADRFPVEVEFVDVDNPV